MNPESTDIHIYANLADQNLYVGQLKIFNPALERRNCFQYANSWLKSSYNFALEPNLPLRRKVFFTRNINGLFAFINDSVQDRFNRMLFRVEKFYTTKDKIDIRQDIEITDYLLNSVDEFRQGALRFTLKKNALGENNSMKDAIATDEYLLYLAKKFNQIFLQNYQNEYNNWIFGSLKASRPKACLYDEFGTLQLAKFQRPDDEVDMPAFESLALTLAQKAGLYVAKHKLVRLDNHSIILIERFDRRKNYRIPYLSLKGLMGVEDHDEENKYSYIDIAKKLKDYGSNKSANLHELWKRIIFSILISSIDNHLENEGLLLSFDNKWDLSPAFDLNPIPIDIRPKTFVISIDGKTKDVSIDVALSVCKQFDLDYKAAKEIVCHIQKVVKGWRQQAKNMGIKQNQVDRISSAFEK